jgi:hypothetical protein
VLLKIKLLSLFPITRELSKSGAKIVIFFSLRNIYLALFFKSSTLMLMSLPMGLLSL